MYWRGKRAWGNVRDFADVGGSQEPLVTNGEGLATTDAEVAEELAARRLVALKALRAKRHLTGLDRTATLAEFSTETPVEKRPLRAITLPHLNLDEVIR